MDAQQQDFSMPTYNQIRDNGQWLPDADGDGWKGDRGLNVEFYFNIETEQDHVKIKCDKWTTLDVPVNEHYMLRFPRQWAAYKQQTDQMADQTRLEEVGWIPDETRLMLKGRGLMSLEQLAGVPDTAMGMGMHKLRERARQQLAGQEQTKPFTELKDENDALKAQVSRQDQQIADLMARLDAMEQKETAPQRRQAAAKK